jgi:transposase
MEFVEDAKRAGRPKEITEAIEKSVIQSITKDQSGREKSSEILANEAGISHSSVLRILKRHGFVVVKPSWKPGLTDAAKAKRLKFCLDHQYWTLNDWKNVIWTDETSVVLGHRRGAVRV